jgi:hypothetical protein
MDDADPPVHVRRLFSDPLTGSFSTLVRFPEGWRRPELGHYPVDEEALFMDGSFEMSGHMYGPRSYAYFPAGYPRESSSSRHGAFALAWFGGRGRWRRGRAAPWDPGVEIPDWDALPLSESPLGRGRMLRRHPSGDTWILERAPSGRSPAHAVAEMLSLVNQAWVRLDPGESFPTWAGPIFCRFRLVGR